MKIRPASIVAAVFFLTLALGAATPAPAEEPGDLRELRAHPLTWILDHRSGMGVRVSDAIAASENARRPIAAQFATVLPTGYSPAQVRRGYGFDQLDADGTGQVIGIPTAFHYPTAGADLKKFIKTFKLPSMFGLPGKPSCTVAAGPHPCFEVVFARGVEPAFDPGWGLESALDVQWAHAIAPGADILLVEASSDFFVDLFQALFVATNLGATVVSMSWGATEIEGLHIFEPLLVKSGVTFVAGSGDDGNGSFYPAVSPNVIAAGGTRLALSQDGTRKSEVTWNGSGGGISPLFPEPAYQTGFPTPPTGGFRGFPDVSYHADPEYGYAAYISHDAAGISGWITVGGTSAASPQWAALIALVNELRGGDNLSGHDLLESPIYDVAHQDDPKLFFDIKSGSNGACGDVCTARKGYDLVTGFGSPRADALVEALANE